MALVVKDRVKETTTTTGTGTITLAGAVDGFQSFSAALADGDTTYYAISETSTGEWEVGLGTFTATGTTLARTTILASSNAGSAVSLTAEADVFITQPASKSAFFDASGDLTLNQDPTSALHAATKEYVDTIAAAGLHYHDPVRVEQEGNLSATYNNGTAGVGATLTNNSTQAALSIDGVTLSLNDRVLIYEQTNAFENGVYTVTDTGSASTNWVLTRSTDTDSYAPSDPDSLGQGDAFFVLEGAAGAGELYVMNTEGTITFGTTGITFTQVAATAVFTAGDGLTLTGTTFAVGAGTGVTVNANDIAIGQAVGTSDSPTFAGMTTTADITFGTNDKASFGTTLDIYSDGTTSYIQESGSGNFAIDGSNIFIRNAAGTGNMAAFVDGGASTLYHNTSAKITTASYGIDVTGNVQSDGLIVDGDATFDTNTLFVDSTNNRVGVGNIAPATALDVTGTVTADGLTVDGSLDVNHNNITQTANSPRIDLIEADVTDENTRIWQTAGQLRIYSISDDTLSYSERIRLDHGTGDISFYEDTGTTAKFFWDASAESLGIGTSSPSAKLDIAETDSVTYSSSAVQGDLIISRKNSANTVNQVVGLEFDVTGWSGSTTGVAGISAIQTGSNASSAALAFQTRNAGTVAERMRIDSSGNVGIGTTQQAHKLSLEQSNKIGWVSTVGTDKAAIEFSGTDDSLRFYNNTGSTERMRIDSSGNVIVKAGNELRVNRPDDATYGAISHGASGTGIVYNDLNGDGHHWQFAGSEKMRIDSSGNLLVGKTSANATDNGVWINNNGTSWFTQTSDYALGINRKTTDGSIINFSKDGTTVGSIGTRGGLVRIGKGDTGLEFHDADNTIYPANLSTNSLPDNAINLGSSNYRFKDLYLSGAAYTHSIAKQTTAPIVINSTLSSSKALRVYYDMDIYNTINFTDASWNLQGRISGASGNLNLTPATGGSVLITSTNDAMLKLVGSNTWAGISFDDSGSVTDYIWYNGTYGTFAIGGGGSNVSGKKLHVDGGMTIGSNYDGTSSGTNSLKIEGNCTASAFYGDGSNLTNLPASTPTTGFTVTGTITATKFVASSDINLKENIKLLESPTDKLSAISGYSYNFKETGEKSYGVIAQEVEGVLPDAVHTNDKGIKSVDYNAIIALLVEAVKSQQFQIDELTRKLEG